MLGGLFLRKRILYFCCWKAGVSSLMSATLIVRSCVVERGGESWSEVIIVSTCLVRCSRFRDRITDSVFGRVVG